MIIWNNLHTYFKFCKNRSDRIFLQLFNLQWNDKFTTFYFLLSFLVPENIIWNNTQVFIGVIKIIFIFCAQ